MIIPQPSQARGIQQVGLGTLLLVLVLAPYLGGAPAGEKYRSEVLQGALRLLVLLAALCSQVSVSRSLSSFALWGAVAWTTLSLLVHSQFLTSPILLFAQLPATLDLLCGVLVFALVARTQESDRPKLVSALLVGLGLHALMAAQQYGAAKQAGEEWQRATGFFFSANFSAGFGALLLPLAVCACLKAEHRLVALGFGTVAALGFGAVVASGSRVGGPVSLLGVAVALVLGFRKTLPWPRLAAVLLASAVLAFGFKGALASRETKTGGPAATARRVPFVDNFRLYTWQGTATMALRNPVFGTGPGTFPYLYPRYASVAQTDLAHQSYLQVAAESGIPAAIGLLVAAVGALLVGLRRRADLLVCGLLGGLSASLIRSCFDSEWALLGNFLPFCAVIGLLSSPASEKRGSVWPVRLIAALGVLVALANQLGGFPPQPSALVASGLKGLEEAARIEPTPRWHFQLARLAQSEGRLTEAVAAFQKAREADPNNLQTLRALAETQEKAGDKAGAESSWRELVRVAEGLVGRERALPEVTETHPAFAYAALGEWGKCADTIEAYSRTELPYQKMELGDYSIKAIEKAQSRRAEVRALYERSMEHLPERAMQKQETLNRLDKFFIPAS